jgi:hypothetical protein
MDLDDTLEEDAPAGSVVDRNIVVVPAGSVVDMLLKDH